MNSLNSTKFYQIFFVSLLPPPMTSILNLPDELILEILSISDKNLHYTCKLLLAIGYTMHHSTLESPPRVAITGNKVEKSTDRMRA